MTAGNSLESEARRLRWFLAGVGMFAVILVVATAFVLTRATPDGGTTVGERLAGLRVERASLEARADGEARLRLLGALRTAGLLTDALGARHEVEMERPFDALPASRQQAFAELEALTSTLREALARSSEGARLAAREASSRALQALERLAATGDDLPVVLSYTPRFVAPRGATGELTMAPQAPPPPSETPLRLDMPRAGAGDPAPPTVPRYAPAFAVAAAEDSPVRIEVVGVRLSGSGGARPVLTIGNWRIEAETAPERLFFSVPRAAFATDGLRTTLASGSLAVRRGARTLNFQLAFVVLPDRPGSFALDQKVRETVEESNTLVSPEVLARAGTGETRTTRRCFDPPTGWRFDKNKRRVVIVERLGWIDDMSDETMNVGSVEFAADEAPEQICFVVTAKPAGKAGRTATIGRFEATLVRDRSVERAVRSGIRALDWREAARVPIESGTIEQKLYVRLFDEIDIDAAGDLAANGTAASPLPFLRISIDRERRLLVLQADPAREP